MWGINPLVTGKILISAGATSLLFGQNGSIKILTQKIKLYASGKNAEAAKSMARSIARQDRRMYEELKRKLAQELSPELHKDIFGEPDE